MHDKLTEWVHSASLSIYLRNWANFVVEKNDLDEDIEGLKLTDFAADVHGNIDAKDNSPFQDEAFNPHEASKGLTATEVHFDKLGTLTAI